MVVAVGKGPVRTAVEAVQQGGAHPQRQVRFAVDVVDDLVGDSAEPVGPAGHRHTGPGLGNGAAGARCTGVDTGGLVYSPVAGCR
jgi:hypothetical protein